ncbi:hypothetical protein [Streptomyces sp. NPDC059003]
MLGTGGHAVRMPDRRPPFVPGMDAAGVIDQLGPGADDRTPRPGRAGQGRHVPEVPGTAVTAEAHRGVRSGGGRQARSTQSRRARGVGGRVRAARRSASPGSPPRGRFTWRRAIRCTNWPRPRRAPASA